MGGAIGLECRAGGGSTCWFTAVFETPPETVESLPAKEHGATLRRFSSACLDPSRGAAHIRKGARILVAEDNATNQSVFLAQLEKLGYQCHIASDGAEAVEALRKEKFDLVLMDCQMPRMDGFEAARRIRESGEMDIPIIAVTASAMSTDRERCIRGGMSDYLSKPVEIGVLSEMLAKWLSEPDETRPVFDEEALLQRLLGDRQLADRVVRAFLERLPFPAKQFAHAASTGR